MLQRKISDIFQSGMARPNRFQVFINPPSGIPATDLPQDKILYNAERIEIPQIGVSNVDYNLDQSLNIQVPFKRVPQGTLNITFQLDENHTIRKFIERWMEYLVTGRPNSPTYFASEYYTNSTGTILVSQLDVSNSRGTTIMTFQGAYPSQTQPFIYDWNERDSYLQYVVTFNYYNLR
jgi:hypothetical protein